jgi:LysR family hydrogen peroxide-inducible transcriptional activator
MEIHQIRYFCAVSETGSFTRAAAAQHIAQPSLSQQIMKLEDELGAKLFDRLGRQVRLTEFGQVFLPRAHSILRELGEAKTEIQEMAGAHRGVVNIGAIPTVAPYLLPQSLPAFSKKYPFVRLNILEEITPVLLERLHSGALDLAIMALPIAGPEFTSIELKKERLLLVLPIDHALASEKSVKLSQFSCEPFLLLKEGHCFRETAISACQRAKVSPNIVFESGQFASITGMVAAGLGVSIVPESALEPRKGCRFIPIADDRAYRRIGLVSLKNHFRTNAQRALIQHLRRATRSNS